MSLGVLMTTMLCCTFGQVVFFMLSVAGMFAAARMAPAVVGAPDLAMSRPPCGHHYLVILALQCWHACALITCALTFLSSVSLDLVGVVVLFPL